MRSCSSLIWVLLVLFHGRVPAPGAEIPSHASLKAALEAAAADQSLVLLIFEADWCAPCQAFKKQTLAAPEFQKSAGALRVARVNIDNDPKTAGQFDVTAIPAMALLSSDGKLLQRRTGFASVSQLLDWLNEGRRRLSQGIWEGTFAGDAVEKFRAKAVVGRLSASDLKELIARLGEPDPAERAAIGNLLLAQRDQSVPLLLDALTDSYLGVRVAASELLRKIAAPLGEADPWETPEQLKDSLTRLKQWWTENKNSLGPAQIPLDPVSKNSIAASLNAIFSDDVAKRSEAMAALVRQGEPALPQLREAIKRAERAGNQRVLTLLEDVRWGILISDTLEQRTTGARRALARGNSLERQAATARLASGHAAALPALAELANDPDALVAESAVRALSGIGGKQAIPAMAALLKAQDSNLRMTAAQALGRSKSAAATDYLLPAVADANEIVACTALAAIEEIHSRDDSSKSLLPQEAIPALMAALGDTRWRVRAAAAEVVGKLKVSALVPELKKLLNDTDSFVVKSALAGLMDADAMPDTDEITPLVQRLPALRSDLLGMLVKEHKTDKIEIFSAVYEAGNAKEKEAVLAALKQSQYTQNQSDDGWKPFLVKVLAEKDPRLRRGAAAVLGGRSPALAAELVSPLLSDEHLEARIAAAEVVIGLISGKRRAWDTASPYSYMAMVDLGALDEDDDETPTPTKKNAFKITAQQLKTWDDALRQRSGGDSNACIATALYLTSASTNELAGLISAFNNLPVETGTRLAQLGAMDAVLPRLPWPDGKPFIEAVSSSPPLFSSALLAVSKLGPQFADYLAEPQRLTAALEPASGQQIQLSLQLLLASRGKGWTLMSPGERAVRARAALAESTNHFWRAAAIYAMARKQPERSTNFFQAAARDSNQYVRIAAIQGFAAAGLERAALEERVGPLVADRDITVAAMAALALLQPETLNAAGLEYSFETFHAGGIHADSFYSSSSSSSEQRPPEVLQAKPAFLQPARAWLTNSAKEQLAPFVLLLAQYGDFSGIDVLAANSGDDERTHSQSLPDALLVAITLSRDAKYVPYVARLIDSRKADYHLRKLLGALRGMPGPEARALRLKINQHLRFATES